LTWQGRHLRASSAAGAGTVVTAALARGVVIERQPSKATTA
jgi:hypothetical protein